MTDEPPDVYCWEDWKKEAKSEHPFRFFMSDTLTRWLRVHIAMRIEHWWYWLRTHTYNRYHILDLRDKEHGYKWGWIDTDSKMLIACFKLLCDYVEKEDPFTHFTWDDHDERRATAVEIKELYRWWKEDEPKMDDFDFDDKTKDYHQHTLDAAAKRTEMLIRLVKIREELWT